MAKKQRTNERKLVYATVFMLLGVLYLASVANFIGNPSLSRAEIIVAPFFAQLADEQPDQYTAWDLPLSRYLNPFFLLREVIH